MEKQVTSIVSAYLKLKLPVDPDTTLESLGFTSFSFIELVLRIEADTGLEFEDRYLSYLEFKRLSDVVRYCEQLQDRVVLGCKTSAH